jgi:molybdopterin synthase sulfur carrier subunit
MVTLVFLGKFRGLARDDFVADLPPDVRTLADLRAWITGRDPALGEAMAGTRTQLVLNHEIVRDMTRAVSDGDEVAFLPPMSGG